jgi:pimeloyl-ACP methyl ester carboxylesterase
MFTRFVVVILLCAPVTAQAAVKPFTRDEARGIIASVQKIVASDGVDKQIAVPINGTKQWVTIRGRDRSNPILLFLHGGPGAPEMPTSWTFQNGWEDYFTVVQWDQRGSGKTYNANDPVRIGPTLTVPQMVDDAAAVVQYLRKTYHRRKIFVLGHSWGSAIGLELANEHPDWLYAYVGVGQIINMHEGERVGYAWTLKTAEQRHHTKAVAELRAIAPYPEADGSLPLAKINTERKWNVLFGGLTYGRGSYDYYENAGKLSPDYTDEDLLAIDKGSALSLLRLLPGLAKFDYANVTDFRCPIVMFLGRHDETTPSSVVAQWFNRVHAPSKKLVWFENSAHMVQIEEPGRLLVHLVEDIRPYATGDDARYRPAHVTPN